MMFDVWTCYYYYLHSSNVIGGYIIQHSVTIIIIINYYGNNVQRDYSLNTYKPIKKFKKPTNTLLHIRVTPFVFYYLFIFCIKL